MGFELAGFDEFRDAFRRLKERGHEVADEGVKEHLERTVKPLSDEMVPKLTLALLETARLEPGKFGKGWSLIYGNSKVEDPSLVDYAAAVHEREDVHHAPPTGAKFLYKPMHETKGEIGKRVGEKLNTLIQEG